MGWAEMPVFGEKYVSNLKPYKKFKTAAQSSVI